MRILIQGNVSAKQQCPRKPSSLSCLPHPTIPLPPWRQSQMTEEEVEIGDTGVPGLFSLPATPQAEVDRALPALASCTAPKKPD